MRVSFIAGKLSYTQWILMIHQINRWVWEVPHFGRSYTLWLCKNSYGKGTIYRMFTYKKMVMFNSYVSLPEGIPRLVKKNKKNCCETGGTKKIHHPNGRIASLENQHEFESANLEFKGITRSRGPMTRHTSTIDPWDDLLGSPTG